jgi:protein-tyrosine phosphatase
VDVDRVLVVCTGNQCRSPAAEALLRRRLGEHAQAFEIWSAGTVAHEGEGLHELTAEALAQQGIRVRSHRARRLVAEDVRGADLVLCAERRHRVHVVGLDPQAAVKTFTIVEFARLAPHLPTGRLTSIVTEAAALRASFPAEQPGDDDVKDPVRGTYEDHARMVRLLAGLTVPLASALVAGWTGSARDRVGSEAT